MTDFYLSIPGYVPVKEAAAMLHVSDKRVLQYIKTKRLPARKVGGRNLIPLPAIEAFQSKPHGRVRTRPIPWHTYRTGTPVRSLYIKVDIKDGKREILLERLQTVIQAQQYLFPGTMSRFIYVDTDHPTSISILLIWKSTELANEAAFQQDLEAFQADFADCLDWAHASFSGGEIIAQT